MSLPSDGTDDCRPAFETTTASRRETHTIV